MSRVRLEPAEDREALVPLLLEADESESILRSYLHEGDLYRIVADGEEVGVVLLIPEGGALEIKNVAQPARVALTGKSASPGLFEMMAVLGREVTVFRLRKGAEIARGAGAV